MPKCEWCPKIITGTKGMGKHLQRCPGRLQRFQASASQAVATQAAEIAAQEKAQLAAQQDFVEPEHEITRAPSPLPPRPSGCPNRRIRLPARYRDDVPEPPAPVPPPASLPDPELRMDTGRGYTRGVVPAGVGGYGELVRQEKGVKAFDKLFSVAPELLLVVKQLFLEASVNSERWDRFLTLMSSVAHNAREGDSNGLKHRLNYLLPNPHKDVLFPPIPEQQSKSDRGLVHPMLRYYILGWRDRLKLPPLVLRPPPPPRPNNANSDDGAQTGSTPSDDMTNVESNAFLKRVAECKVKLKAKNFPSCFYEDGTYDPENLDHGLMRGDIIVRVLRHIWTGPTSALNGLDKGMPATCNARLHGVYLLDGEMVGYAGVQARTMIGTSDWVTRDGSYDFEDLFDRIVTLFEDVEDPWVKETLGWLQNQVFGDAAIPQVDSDKDSDSDDDDALAQRAARPHYNDLTKLSFPLLYLMDPYACSLLARILSTARCEPKRSHAQFLQALPRIMTENNLLLYRRLYPSLHPKLYPRTACCFSLKP
ncbi:hypothetical protein B0H19DRAFT_1276257 [Mycena capillaripes]|nr:hypothetical protein B0H19DRAFT_1276257 [Mycena capillaripes]